MKIRTILMVTAVVSASAACAQGLTPAGKPRVPKTGKPAKVLTPEEVEQNKAKAAAFQKYIDGMGGMVSVPLSGPALRLVDATAKGWAMEGLEQVKGNLDRYGLCPSEVQRKPVSGDVLAAGRALVRDSSGVVMIVDGAADAPLTTVHPDEHLALVNMTALCKGASTSGPRQDRVEKLTWRAIGHLVGCGAPEGYVCVMKPVRNLAELDAIPKKFIHPATFFKTRAYFDMFGVKLAQTGIYEMAVQEGWAPAPTNDVQKAIWDKVHAPPTKPMKITFDKEKGKPVVK